MSDLDTGNAGGESQGDTSSAPDASAAREAAATVAIDTTPGGVTAEREPTTKQAKQHRHRLQELIAREEAASGGANIGESAKDAENAEAAPVVEDDKKPADTDDAVKAKADAEGKAKTDEKAKDPKLADKFAALHREHNRVIDSTAQLDAKSRAFADHQRSATEQLSRREADLTAREQKIKDADERDHLLLANDPAKLWDRLIALGVTDKTALSAIADGKWAEHRKKQEEASKPAPKPEDKPMTRAEMDAYLAEKQKTATEQAKYAGAVSDFTKLIESANDDGTDKFAAAATIWSRAKRVKEGDQIATALMKNGVDFTLDDVAEAVNALAERHPRWQKVQKRGAQAASATTAKPAATDAATKALASSARQSSPGHVTPASGASPSVATPTNGAGPKLSHNERMKKMYQDAS